MKRIALPVVLALVALILVITPVLAQFEVITRAVTGNTTLTPMAQATAEATGFTEGDIVDVTVNGATVGRGVADSGGELVVTYTVSTDLPYGTYTVGAKNQSGVTATGYTAQVTPTLRTKSSTGAPGSTLIINGFGFAATQPYTVSWETTSNGTGGKILGTGTTSKFGSLYISTTVPISAAGTYYVRGTAANTGGVYVTAP